MTAVKLSASQIKKYRRCPRQWAYRYIEGRPEPTSKSAELGSEVHQVIESFFLHNSPMPDTRAGRIAKSGLHILQPYKDLYAGGLQVEQEFTFELWGATMRGFIDLSVTDEPVVIDHKTSSDPRKYGLTPESLADDVQALMYAYAKLNVPGMTREVDGDPAETIPYPVVELKWIYYSTRSATPAYVVDAILTREEVESKTTALRPTIEEMVEAKRTITDAGTLKGNADACGDFGGCPHASVCSIGNNPETQLVMLWGEQVKGKKTKMGLKELAAKRRAQVNGTTALARDLNPPEAPESVDEELKKSEQRYKEISGVEKQVELPTPKPTTKKAKKSSKPKTSLESEARQLWVQMACAHGVQAAEEAVEAYFKRFG